jgi:subtilisin family serine protease
MKHFLSLVFVLSVISNASAQRLDVGIEDDDRFRPVFIRMTDQLIRQAGDYEKFSEKHSNRKRKELREEVLNSLRSKSKASWKSVEAKVQQLEKNGHLRSVKRYWIVNGFACEARGSACQELAKIEGVSFVYLQRLRGVPLHKASRRGAIPGDQQKRVYQNVISKWKDDSNEPFIAKDLTIPWNIKRIKADRAWPLATGKGVVIALCDTGLMVTPALTRALWKNPNETLNGKDDDGNGYVDDVFGYDFGNDSWYALGDGATMTHGSMCGGIMAGRPLNKKSMVTGVAPRAKLMVLRGMGHLKAYEYAVANGADIMSMSYMWSGIALGNYRGIYRLAHEHMSAAGVLAVGGAGNFGAGPRAQPAGKQIAMPKDIPCVIAAAGIIEDGTQPSFSSKGPCYWIDVKYYSDYPKDKPLRKPDVTGCIGGYPVWGRPSAVLRTRGRWKLFSDEGKDIGLITGPQGNSFSGPHAAGVAALMLSANRELKPWQLKSIMEQTCDDLGENGWDKKYGAGLLNAVAAVNAAKAKAIAK